MNKVLLILVATMLCALGALTVNCSHVNPETFPNPKIEAGIAKLSGKLTGFERKDGSQPSLEIRLTDIVTATQREFDIEVEDDGSFYLEIPVVSDIIWATAVVYDHYAQLVLTTHQQTWLELGLDDQGKFHANMDGYVALTEADMIHFIDALMQILNTPRSSDYQYSAEQEKYIDNAMRGIEKADEIVRKDSILSEPTKIILLNGFKMVGLDMVLLDYSGMIPLRYMNSHPEEEWDNFVAPEEPGREYYKFLRQFNLNDPQYLLTGELYSRVLQKLFTIDALAIPPIDETPVTEWLDGVKATLADVVGFSEGQFYDLLVSNAYGRQFEMETRPLSEKQIANIKDYFKGSKAAFAKILMRRNAEIEKLATGVSELVVNETPDVPDEQLLDAIVAKHKGKVVVIDFWATWCTPCLQAIKQIREMKSEFNPDGIAYVYLTCSPPEELWREMIVGIGGEHYRLPEEQWDYLIDKFDFEGIPSYVIIDSVGEVHDSFTGYPGNDRMKKIITELLQ